jgi:multicomponent Na+:H+ antiporter subunit D
MTPSLLLAWLLLPLAAAFVAILLPSTGRWLRFCIPALSAGLAVWLIVGDLSLPLDLVESPGVTLSLASEQIPLIFANALVTLAVAIHTREEHANHLKTPLLLLLHGALNSLYLAADLISIYVAIELISIIAFLLVVDLKRTSTLWIAFRYLLFGDLAMLIFLLGTLVIYADQGDFAISAAANASGLSINLLTLGLLIKTGAFLPGFWLPKTHAAASADISALLSGIVVTAGAAPLARLGQLNPIAATQLTILGLFSIVIGAAAAMVQRDVKRLLAWSTVSQMGYVLMAPAVAGLYAMAHGLAKAALFLCAGQMHSRDMQILQTQPERSGMSPVLLLASLSLVGMPLFIGYGAKAALLKALPDQLGGLVGWLGIGTAVVLARLLPDQWQTMRPSSGRSLKLLAPWLLVSLLVIGPSLLGVSLGLSAATTAKSLLVVGTGILIERLLRQPLRSWSPPELERFSDVSVALGVTVVICQLVVNTPLPSLLPMP